MLKRETLDSIENGKLSAPVGIKSDAELVLVAMKEYLALPSAGNSRTLSSCCEAYQVAWMKNAYIEQENNQ